MYIDAFINHEIPSLTATHTIAEALDMMRDFLVSELPFVDNGRLVALVDEDTLLDAADPSAVVVKHASLKASPVVAITAHPYEAACRMAEFKLSLLPVIDEQEQYLGVVTRHDLFQYLFEPATGLAFPGAVMVLSMKPVDYSLSEIARICESCDTTILNVQVFTDAQSENMDVVLKTNKKDLQALRASFERFEYNVKEIFGAQPDQGNLIERYRLLMNYINM
ncbi:MAG TPA: CBS domain-containing protein [Edaphocola sp.]|nr:CBS domain-containing protein [Edaphocola sp.]